MSGATDWRQEPHRNQAFLLTHRTSGPEGIDRTRCRCSGREPKNLGAARRKSLPPPYSSGNGSFSLTNACDSRMDSPRLVLSPHDS